MLSKRASRHELGGVLWPRGWSPVLIWALLAIGIGQPAVAQNIANPDSFTMRLGGKARVNVISNDSGYVSGAVEIITPPTFGTATAIGDGTVLYSQTIGAPTTDSFTYRLPATSSFPASSPTTVTVNFTSAPRFASDFVKLPAQGPLAIWQVSNAFPNLTFSAPNNMCPVPGDPQKLLLVESAGGIWMVTNIGGASPGKTLFLNLTGRVRTDLFERGAKGVACHPNFASNGYIYVAYDYLTNNIGKIRLSRFTRSAANPLVADPNSELVLIEQTDDGPYHDIDTCKFGPDGYLYLSIGDEGGQNEDYQNAQRIDKDMYSCMIRIDVDKKPGNLEPNADSNVPRYAGGLAAYSVPSDNPFVGATSFNHQTVNPAQVRTELYIVGLRNPWQFSFAPDTNKLWVADVGRDAREEISLLGGGDNGGWSWREGSIPGPRTGQLINGASEADATLTGPVFEYDHTIGQCITGGYVYTNTNYPDLMGKYLFADYLSGNIWTISPTNPAATFTRITGGNSIVSFMPDPHNGDVLVISRVGYIGRLVKAVDDTGFPRSLTATGFFADLTDLTPNPGAEAYTPNVRFWSDYADKRRWFLIKDATNMMQYSRDGSWSFPPGMIWVKHFDLDLERNNPATSQRIETRFLVKTADGAYGVSYQWNGAGTSAFLVPDGGTNFDLNVIENGVSRVQHYHIPARSECLTCHNVQAGSALSFTMRQLNRDGTIAGAAGNQLGLLSACGYVTGMSDDPQVLPRLVGPDETQYSLESRVRSYLAVNCAYCHQPGGTGPPSWDGRPQLNLWETAMVNGLPLAGSLDPSHRIVVPGDPTRSILWTRLTGTNSYTRMPPLATSEIDQQSVQLVADWISNSLPSRQDYNAWRLSHFGDLVSAQGQPDADPDGDGHSNFAEFLTYSDPTNGHNFYSPIVTAGGGQFTFQVPNFSGRSILVETSTDLGMADPWQPWDVPSNNGIPLETGGTNTLTGTISDPHRYFKIMIGEE